MKTRFVCAVVVVACAVHLPALAQETSLDRVDGRPATPGAAFGYTAGMYRVGGGAELSDFTVGGIFSVRHPSGVHQWAMATVNEAWALPGSRSILVGFESAVVNEEPTNTYPKIAVAAVMKNRADNLHVDAPGAATGH